MSDRMQALVEAARAVLARYGENGVFMASDEAKSLRAALAAVEEERVAVAWRDSPDRAEYHWNVDEFAIVNGRHCDVWQTAKDGAIWWQVLDSEDEERGHEIASGTEPTISEARATAERHAKQAAEKAAGR